MTDEPKPRPNLATLDMALQEAIGCLIHALEDGEVPNPILGESMKHTLIREEAIARRWLEEN